MNRMHIVPVLLAGGIGERFWPMSRSSTPKQLLPLISNKSMIQETLDRVTPVIADDVKPLIITGSSIAAKLKKGLDKNTPCDTIAEPVGKNTAPAVLLGALWLRRKYGECVMAVLSADHAIKPRTSFITSLKFAAGIAAQQDRLVVFGIEPSRPDTGYGYIHLGKALATRGKHRSFEVRTFVEKPTLPRAKRYVSSGRYLWNSGMFVWTTSVILEEFARSMPRLFEQGLQVERGRFTLKAIDAYYHACEKESVDYGIMEHSHRVAAVKAAFQWDDVGSWESVSRLHKGNRRNTTASGDNIYEAECRDSIIVNNSALTVAALGVDNLVVVTTDDAVLVIPRDRLPGIKKFLGEMKKDARLPTHLF
ncbi:MAG: mannose-1-phosphate guanylyltransferase [Chitinivibrionales bacterium]|nr:mannose-1-phosphate guanylyltransferase [Chitinivibrionales bacterium]